MTPQQERELIEVLERIVKALESIQGAVSFAAGILLGVALFLMWFR